jgi:hypothetical protein
VVTLPYPIAAAIPGNRMDREMFSPESAAERGSMRYCSAAWLPRRRCRLAPTAVRAARTRAFRGMEKHW